MIHVLQDQVVKVEPVPATVNGATEENLPSNCAIVRFVDLVARAPRRRANNSGDAPEGHTKWNGKLVKNFKKFKKVLLVKESAACTHKFVSYNFVVSTKQACCRAYALQSFAC